MDLTRHRRAGWLVALSLAAAACATAPPVQEMSDARQAITAARDAGAARHDAAALERAESQLAQAEVRLQQHAWWDARRLALGAKENAVTALRRSRAAEDAAGSATGDPAVRGR